MIKFSHKNNKNFTPCVCECIFFQLFKLINLNQQWEKGNKPLQQQKSNKNDKEKNGEKLRGKWGRR